jgi:hypothetical protein
MHTVQTVVVVLGTIRTCETQSALGDTGELPCTRCPFSREDVV